MTKVAEKKAEIETLEYEVARMAGGETPSSAALWRSLVEGVLDMDESARAKARRLFSDTFERIDVYNKGYAADTPEIIECELLSKRGGAIALQIMRKTGEWTARRITRKKKAA